MFGLRLWGQGQVRNEPYFVPQWLKASTLDSLLTGDLFVLSKCENKLFWLIFATIVDKVLGQLFASVYDRVLVYGLLTLVELWFRFFLLPIVGKIYIYDLRSGSTPVSTTVAHKTSVQSLAFRSLSKVSFCFLVLIKLFNLTVTGNLVPREFIFSSTFKKGLIKRWAY